MTVSFFQTAGRLHLALTQALSRLTHRASDAALQDLRSLPEFRDLASLAELTEPRRLTGLLFDPERYDAVARRLGVPPEARREVFGRETRASRILPQFCTLSRQPRLWLEDGLRREAYATFQAAAEAAMDDWRNAKVRRIGPRGKEPIGLWTAQRSLMIGPAALIAEYTTLIQEDLTGVEHYVAHAKLKLTDWRGRLLGREIIYGMVQNPFLGAQAGQEGAFESRFEGIFPGTDYPWRLWSVPRNLAINVVSPRLHRRQRKELGSFFRVANEKCRDVLGFLLANRS